MKKLLKTTALLLCVIQASDVIADEAAIRKALSVFMPSGEVDSIKPSEIKGLYEVAAGATIFYASEDGKYLLQGQLFDAEAKKNITETKLAEVRKNALEKIGEQQMIVFKAPISKYTVSIFTDIDCGYCRKLHSEIDQYLAQGISVRYLFFPRAGKGSDSYKKAIAVWCSADRNKALTLAKKGDALDGKTCENPIDKHMQLGEEFGMTGTPMIVTEKGNILPGYVPAAQLAKVLASE